MRKGISIIFITLIIGITVSQLKPASDTTGTDPQYAGGSSRLAVLLGGREIEGYTQAAGPRDFSFPQDHGPHRDFRNEWWYITGNLDGERDERFGFELTIFRFSLTPEQDHDRNASAWKTNQVYIGHFAITDVVNESFHVAQRYARGSLGLAGAQAEPFQVWLEDWSIRCKNNNWQINASDKDMAIDLTLSPVKPLVLNGIDGLSQKSSEPGNASYYYSIPRLRTVGTLQIKDENYSVTGLSWLDHEWGSSGLSEEQQGWDWFALQLSDGSDLMFYSLRKIDGSRDPYSAGIWITADGQSMHLSDDDVDIDVEDHWDSPLGGTYPSAWRLRIPQIDLDLRLRPVLDAQELRTTVRYWEGAVDVVGKKAGMPVEGRGYVELTGYAPPDNGAG